MAYVYSFVVACPPKSFVLTCKQRKHKYIQSIFVKYVIICHTFVTHILHSLVTNGEFDMMAYKSLVAHSEYWYTWITINN
jgi:hypothetical protein